MPQTDFWRETMVIYGLTLLSGCMFAGMLLGDILGAVLGINSNIGGVGFAMLFLIILSNKLLKKDALSEQAQSGIQFWSSMYSPIVVAMTAQQDVVAAISGGPLAILAGILAVIVGFAFIPLLSKLGGKAEPLPPLEGEGGKQE